MAQKLSFLTRPFRWFWNLSKIKKFLLIAILLGIGGWQYYSYQNRGIEVDMVAAQKGELVESVSASGEISALEKADLTFQAGGKLTWVGVKEGDTVTKGQLIAALDKTQMQQTLKKYLNTYDRERTEFNDTSDSADDVTLDDTVRRIKERAQVDLNQTVIDVEIQNEALKLANLYTPIAGIVTKAEPSYPGVNVTALNASYQVVNPDTVYFEAEVNEVDIPRLTSTTPVEVRLTAYPDEVLHESIYSIGFSSVTTSSGGTAYVIQITLPENDSLKYRLGMNGDVTFILDKKEDILLVPATSVIETDGKSYVWIVTEENKAHKQEVTIGTSSIEDTEIKSGLDEGQKVIDRPGKDVVEGAKIKQST